MRANYATYFPSGAGDDAWGVVATGIGHAVTQPHTPYPPSRHPVDHMLDWENGRVLQTFQLVYISRGRGVFESHATSTRNVRAGTMIILFPGTWHRYQPDNATGWTEDWIELRSETLLRLQQSGVISPESPLYNTGQSPATLEIYDRCHELALTAPLQYGIHLGVLGLELVSQLLMAQSAPRQESASIESAIQRAKDAILDANQEPLVMERLAKEFGMSYSLFRRAFKARTGLTPKQYYAEIRLRKAQNMLVNTRMSVREIANALGYNSAFHLSGEFKKRTEFSPIQWRDQFQSDNP